MLRRLTIAVLLCALAGAPASAPAYNAPISTVGVNLPYPKHTCAQIFQLAGREHHTDRFRRNAETIGSLYQAAVRLNAGRVPDDWDHFTIDQLISAYSDMMGCFVSHTAPGRLAIPAPAPNKS